MPKKHALLVGINNYPGTDSDLAGCINDIDDMHLILRDAFRWPASAIITLKDKDATKKNIESGLRYVIREAQAGDEILFHMSSHGSQIPDIVGDESDHLTEVLCPYDFAQCWEPSKALSDDLLREIFQKKASGANLTCIFDACHTATASRDTTKRRYLNPPAAIAARTNIDLPVNRIGVKQIQYRETAANMNHLLLSACKADQTADDATFNGRPNGAWTYFLSKAIRKLGPNATVHDVFMAGYLGVKQGGHQQRPCLEGNKQLRDRPFLGGAD